MVTLSACISCWTCVIRSAVGLFVRLTGLAAGAMVAGAVVGLAGAATVLIGAA